MSDIKVHKADGTWTVRAGGAILGESKNALVLSEGDMPDIIYFPRDDIAMAFLDDSDHSSHCPKKGDASYFHIITKSQTLENAAWSYENPIAAAARIKDHIAFYASDNVTIEQI